MQVWLWKGDEVQLGAWGMGQTGGPGDRLSKESELMLGDARKHFNQQQV